MAVFTKLSVADANRMARAHGIPDVHTVVPIAAGSVNSNFFLDCMGGERFFARIYEEQHDEGVAFEWALLKQLDEAGIPVPRVQGAATPGAVKVLNKPTAVFSFVEGTMSCQASVSTARALAVGRLLARCHRALGHFELSRPSRFGRDAVRARMTGIDAPELGPLLDLVRRVLDQVDEQSPAGPRCVIHGDLFRDNVFFTGPENSEIAAAIDWESAGLGLMAYDLAVAICAWCFGDDFNWPLAAALVAGYGSVRPLLGVEVDSLRLVLLAACVRFTVTRITDYHLRSSIGERVHKDYRRFARRLREIYALEPAELRRLLSL